MVAPWNEGALQSPLANPELIQQSPLAKADWGDYFGEQISTTGWWNQTPSQFVYGPQMNVGESFDYDPGSVGTMYTPTSSLTQQMIDSDIETWLRREHPELFDFTTGVQYGGVAGVGTVAQDPGFGQFSQDPSVYPEIQAAANKYGVPANFLQTIIAKESSGDWANNSQPVCGIRGMCIHGYVGVFEDAAASWGFNFDALTGNRAGQIEMLASGLRGMYDRLRAQNPEYGWLNVAAMHYSGDPTMQYTPGDSFQHGTTQQYVAQTEAWWKELDALAGNTWSNYTDTTQNTGIGSPQNPAWGRYAQWDEALVGLSANQGAPANLLKSMLRYGDEAGLGYSSDFDDRFGPTAEALTNNYRQLGSWDQAIAATLGTTVESPEYRRVKQYWDELNADGSGLFGAPSQDPSAVPSVQYQAIWGGGSFPITQEHGPTRFSLLPENYDMYDYSLGVLGTLGHPGIDVGMPRGTRLYAPVAGTVIRAGHTGSYEEEMGGEGELRIRTDSGHDLILGHMWQIDVEIGQRLTPGMMVGTSGYANGDHLHLEYRIPDASMSSGWAAVDPRQALGGQFSGFHQGARTGLGYTQPMTFQALMRAGASGQPIPSGPVYSQGGGRSAWTTWLRNEMLGLGNPDTGLNPGRIDYSMIYNSGNPFGSGSVPNVGVPAQTAGGIATANVVLAQAQRFVGVPYVWGAIPGQGDDPWDTGWDCSGFTYWLDQNYGGGSLPMGSHYQYQYGLNNGTISTNTRTLMAGDLVFFDTGSRSGGGAELNGASHVGVYLGGGKMLHAANPSTGTIVSDFNQYTNMYPYLGSMHMAWSGGS